MSRFAMKLPTGWQEGEVVELQAARRAYEDFLHRRQDPALLEKQGGNQFRARVFPIEASADKELILSFSQELRAEGEPYRIHLRGLPEVEALDIRAQVARTRLEAPWPRTSLGGTVNLHEVVEAHRRHWKPDLDFEVPLALADGGRRLGLRHENLAVARLVPLTGAAPDVPAHLVVLFDTSASRAPGFVAQVKRLGEVLHEIGRAAGRAVGVRVLGFDQEVVEVFRGTVDGFGERAEHSLIERRAMGASDLGRALRVAGDRAAPGTRLVVFTDGVATAGAGDGEALRSILSDLAAPAWCAWTPWPPAGSATTSRWGGWPAAGCRAPAWSSTRPTLRRRSRTGSPDGPGAEAGGGGERDGVGASRAAAAPGSGAGHRAPRAHRAPRHDLLPDRPRRGPGRVTHRPVPVAGGPASLRRRAPRSPGRARARAGHRHLPQGARAASRSPRQPPPARLRAAARRAARRGLRHPGGGGAPAISRRALRGRAGDPARGRGDRGRRLPPRSGEAGCHPPAHARRRLAARGGTVAALRASWETDANDVDLHIVDSHGSEASYREKHLPSGGRLYADVTTGYGPECFNIPGPPSAFPYALKAHYYSRGPMGYGMGKLEIVQHDGRGNLRFDERPFVIMADHAFVDLGKVTGPLR